MDKEVFLETMERLSRLIIAENEHETTEVDEFEEAEPNEIEELEDDVFDTDKMAEWEKEQELIEDIFKEKSVIESPIERINAILDSYDQLEFSSSHPIFNRLMEMLPENKRFQDLCSGLLSPMNAASLNTEEMGRIFKECGETLEDMPLEQIDRYFVKGYAIGSKSDDPNVRNNSFMDVMLTKGALIEEVKSALGHHTLSELRNAREQDK